MQTLHNTQIVRELFVDPALGGQFAMPYNPDMAVGKAHPRPLLFNRKLPVMVAHGRARGADAREVAWQATRAGCQASWKHCIVYVALR